MKYKKEKGMLGIRYRNRRKNGKRRVVNYQYVASIGDQERCLLYKWLCKILTSLINGSTFQLFVHYKFIRTR